MRMIPAIAIASLLVFGSAWIPAVYAQADSAADPPAAAKAPELPAMPEKFDSASVMPHLEALQRVSPVEQSRESVTAMVVALGDHLDQLLAKPLDETVATEALGFRHMIHQVAGQLSVPDAAAKRNAWIEQLKKDSRSVYAVAGRGFEILASLRDQGIAVGSEEAWQTVFDRTTALLKDTSASPFGATIAMQVSEASEMAAPTALAATAHNAFAKLFRDSDNENVRGAASVIEGIGRKLSLPGNEMIVNGKTLGGSEFNLASLKGKVVVVDFWATWCPHCIEAFPALEALYEKHREAGLEIVGVNIDDSKELWSEYLADKPLPWLHVQNLGDGESKSHPNADRYGINGIPFLVLIGRDGKVIRTNVVPEELKTLVPEALAAGKG